ncbi:MAG TPA: RimK family alpha-L-glutamate ligase [Saprospiraceae bacterium]|nr:RimK family alpha-L-glutamate ligase [Saprospiraceae bacterium]
MKALILSRNATLYSTQRLVFECRKKRISVDVRDPLTFNCVIHQEGSKIFNEDGKEIKVDVVIPRIGSTITNYGAAILRQFELMKVPITTTSDALLMARDKLVALQKLAAHGLPIPKTSLISPLSVDTEFIKKQFNFPLIIKLLESTHGLGVILSESLNNTQSIAEAFQTLHQKYILQQFIREAQGSDIRAFIVNGELVASMLRSAQGDEFRSNMHRGATAIPIKLTTEEEEIVLRSARILDLSIAGVDFMRSKGGPVILEVNASPGLEGIENVTKVNVAAKIITYARSLAEQNLAGLIKRIG